MTSSMPVRQAVTAVVAADARLDEAGAVIVTPAEDRQSRETRVWHLSHGSLLG
jgi:hypothetical protein